MMTMVSNGYTTILTQERKLLGYQNLVLNIKTKHMIFSFSTVTH